MSSAGKEKKKAALSRKRKLRFPPAFAFLCAISVYIISVSPREFEGSSVVS